MVEAQRKSVLYLSYDGLTDQLGQSQILPYLKGLSKEYLITIISFEKKDLFKKDRTLIDAICKQHHIIWLPVIYHKSPPVLSTLYDLVILWKRVQHLHRRYNFNIIHCRSYITALVGLWMKRIYGIKFIFDMRGFWADERVDGRLWNLKNPFYKLIYKFFKKKEKQFIAEADHVISLTDNAKSEIVSWDINSHITVIPCCVDLDHFDPHKIRPDEKQKLKYTLGIKPDDYVLLYLGSWGTWYMTIEMLYFFNILKEQKRNAKFLIVTTDEVDLRNYSLSSDVIVSKALRSQVPLYISIADSSVFFIKPTYSKKASSATKMGEIMSMNVPVITNTGWGDAEEIIKTTGGHLYKIGSADVEEFFNNTDINTREYCIKNLSLESGVTKYKTIYKAILKDTR